MSKEKYLFLGSIKKTYGVAGALVIQTAGSAYRFKKSWETVFIEIDKILVPFFIESYEQTDIASLIVKIDQFNDRDTASKYIHRDIYIRQSDLSGHTVSAASLQMEGYTIRDKKTGVVGIVKQYLDIKDNPLFLVSGRQQEFYVPANPDFITEIDPENKTIFVQLPEGLADSQQ